MTKSKIIHIIAAMSFGLAGAAQAQQMTIATGGPKGTYHAMYSDIASRCNSEMPVVEVLSTGSMDNLDKLINKKVSAAFMQTDVLFASARAQNLGNIKTLVAFHGESVHVVVPKNSGLKTKGNLVGYGKEDIVFNSVEDLNGYVVAAAGGSLVTAQIIKEQGQVNWTILPVENTAAAKEAIKTGQANAAIFVGGKPLPDVAEMGSDYKLLPFQPQTTELLKTVYVKDQISMPKLSPRPVNTIATEALLVVREVGTEEKTGALSSLRNCIARNIKVWRDADNAHPAWDQVDPSNKGKWTYYALPEATSRPVKK